MELLPPQPEHEQVEANKDGPVLLEAMHRSNTID